MIFLDANVREPKTLQPCARDPDAISGPWSLPPNP
jgi:hypothetical protein